MKKEAIIAIAILVVIVGMIVAVQRGENEEKCNGMDLSEAKQIASQCNATLKEPYVCNEITKTWWLDLNLEKSGCSPACVVNTETRTAEINWRCTGLVA